MRISSLQVIGLVSSVTAVLYLVTSRRYGVGALDNPGPGLYPIFVALVWFAGGIGMLLTRSGEHSPQVTWPTRDGWTRILLLWASFVGFVVLLNPLGYAISSALLCLVGMRIGRFAKLPVQIAAAIVFAAATYYLFTVFLNVPLPQGPLENL